MIRSNKWGFDHFVGGKPSTRQARSGVMHQLRQKRNRIAVKRAAMRWYRWRFAPILPTKGRQGIVPPWRKYRVKSRSDHYKLAYMEKRAQSEGRSVMSIDCGRYGTKWFIF